MKELYFHEDFYCQVELLPMAALKSSESEMNEIDAFSDTHWDGTAWTALYLRQDQSQYLLSLSIPIDTLSAALDSILEPVDKIYTGYGSYQERCINTRGWVLPCRTALLGDFNEAGIVGHLWVVNEPPDSENIEQFRQALTALSIFGDFFIADWNLSIAVPCADDEMLRRYLSGTIEDGV